MRASCELSAPAHITRHARHCSGHRHGSAKQHRATRRGSGTQGRRSDLLDRICAAFLPKLHLWQLAKFSEPAAWHAARLAFTRTNAVWSMVSPPLRAACPCLSPNSSELMYDALSCKPEVLVLLQQHHCGDNVAMDAQAGAMYMPLLTWGSPSIFPLCSVCMAQLWRDKHCLALPAWLSTHPIHGAEG